MIHLQVEGMKIHISTLINNLSMIYDHKDWESLIVYNTEHEISTPVTNLSWKNQFSLFQVYVGTELFDGSIIIKLPSVQEASCGVSHMKYSFNLSPGIITFQ